MGPGGLVVVRDGQYVLTEAARRFRSAVDYDDNVAGLLRPEARTPGVVMDPRRSFGQPAVRSVRTEALAEDFKAGTRREDLADLYDLTLDEVDQAIRFELITGARGAA